MEIAKRTAHMTASLSGFKKVDSFDKVFPPRKKPKTARKSSIGAFFRRYATTKKD